MKKLMIVLLLSCLAGGLIFAQSQQGVRVGLNISTINGKDLGEISSITGYHSGGFVIYPVAKNMLLQMEALITLKGAKTKLAYEDFLGEIIIEENLTFNYMEIPLLLKYNLTRGKFRFQPYAGASFGLLIAANRDYTISWYGTTESGSGDMTKFMKENEYGLNFGTDIFLPLLSEQLLLGVRYNHGLSGILNDTPKRAKNRTWMFSLGYLIRSKE